MYQKNKSCKIQENSKKIGLYNYKKVELNGIRFNLNMKKFLK